MEEEEEKSQAASSGFVCVHVCEDLYMYRKFTKWFNQNNHNKNPETFSPENPRNRIKFCLAL